MQGLDKHKLVQQKSIEAKCRKLVHAEKKKAGTVESEDGWN